MRVSFRLSRNKKPVPDLPDGCRAQETGCAHGLFSDLFNVAASRPAKGPRNGMLALAPLPLGVKGGLVYGQLFERTE
jgi:hypothetical protein